MAEANATTVPAGTPAMSDQQMKDAAAKAKMMKDMAAAGAPKASPGMLAQGSSERNLQLPPARMQGREYANQNHIVAIESSWTMEDVLKPIFWSSVWQKLRRYDEITVVTDDGSWWARLLVVQRGTGYAFVRPLEFVRLDDGATNTSAPAAIEGYEIREMGPHMKWCVIRTADSLTLKEKSESRRDAEDWLRQYQEQQARTTALI